MHNVLIFLLCFSARRYLVTLSCALEIPWYLLRHNNSNVVDLQDVNLNVHTRILPDQICFRHRIRF